jgi:hypothetical protein
LSVASAIVLIALPSLAQADLQRALAQQVNADHRDFVLNIPPRPGCLPGSIFTDDLRVPLERTSSTDDALTRGESFSLDADFESGAGVGGSATLTGLFGFLASHKSSATTSVHVADAMLIDMLGTQLKSRLLASSAAKSAANRGLDPFVVFRAYEGVVSFTVTRKQDTSADAWAKVKANAVEARLNGELRGNDAIVFKIPNRIIFAFEVMRATYVTTHLGAGPNDVQLDRVKASEFTR